MSSVVSPRLPSTSARQKAGGPLKAAFVYVRSSRLAVSSLRRSEGAPFKPDFGLSGAVPHSNPLRQSTAPAASDTSRLPVRSRHHHQPGCPALHAFEGGSLGRLKP